MRRTSNDDRTFGERVADGVAAFGGSWTFIILFAGVMGAWMAINVALLRRPFDPYPFILLNLVLSTLAAIQAPIIMMSQNRAADRDRAQADRTEQHAARTEEIASRLVKLEGRIESKEDRIAAKIDRLLILHAERHPEALSGQE